MADPKPPPIQDNEESAFAAAVDAGLKSLDAGRTLPYEPVRDWLLSWGTDKETAPPECP